MLFDQCGHFKKVSVLIKEFFCADCPDLIRRYHYPYSRDEVPPYRTIIIAYTCTLRVCIGVSNILAISIATLP